MGYVFLDRILAGAATLPAESYQEPIVGLAFEKTRGVTQYDEALKVSFDTFLKQYLQHWNNRLSKHTLPSYLKAPRLLWTFPEKFRADEPEPIRRVVVTQVTTYYHNNHYAEIRKIPVHQILMPR